MKGTLKNGFKYEINEKALESYEFMEILGEASENPLLYTKAFELILGKKQKLELMEYIKKDGYTSADEMTKALQEIFESYKKLKNL